MNDPNSGTSERVQSTAEEARHAAGQIGTTSKEEAGQVVEEIKGQARDLAVEARSQLTDQANAQRERAVESLRDLSTQLSSMVAGNEQDGLGRELVHQASDRVGSVADYLAKREPGDLIEEVRGYARRHPGTFLLGAVAAGVVVGRLARASAAVHSDSVQADSEPSPPQYVTSRSLPGSAPGAYASTRSPDETARFVDPSAYEEKEPLTLPEYPAVPGGSVRGDRP